MARRGRKRKDGPREPNGRISRAAISEREKPTIQMQIRKAAFDCDLGDPVAIWNHKGLISDEQAEALGHFARLRVKAWGSTQASAGPLQDVVGGEPNIPLTDDRLAEARQKYQRAYDALQQAGYRAVRAVEGLIYSGGADWPDLQTLRNVRGGADWLAHHFKT